jgi:hypothetical protein
MTSKILRFDAGHATVPNIAARDALLARFEGMTVMVTDASADPIARTGWAEYKWFADRSKFVMTNRESVDTLRLKKEAFVIVNGQVELTYTPHDGVLWDAFISNPATGECINYPFPPITDNIVTITDPTKEGMTLNVSYGYGDITVSSGDGTNLRTFHALTLGVY